MIKQEKISAVSWMQVMSEGQFTRDEILRTKSEIAQDKEVAAALERRRRELFPDQYSKPK